MSHSTYAINSGKRNSIRSFLFVMILCFPFLKDGYAQETNVLPFDTTRFNSMLQTTQWMCEYESVAWTADETHDRFREMPFIRFGQQGVCLIDSSGQWQVVYGSYKEDIFRPEFAARSESETLITIDPTTVDSVQLLPLFRALNQTYQAISHQTDSIEVHFDQFLRIHPDQSIEIHILPAFQPSGQGIYGAEWKFLYSPDGKKLITSTSYLQDIKGVWIGQPRELWLDYRSTGFPTMGAVYFAWYFKDFFTKIHIDTQLTRSTLSKDKAGNYEWKHLIK